MKIVIIGGSGLIGAKLVASLRSRGHEVVAASPASGVNTITGEGLEEALNGAHIVVDVANSPSFADEAVMDFFQTSGRHLLAAAGRAGVQHHIALSVVGTQRLQQSGYFRAKQAQEDLIRSSRIPFTIVHSTQFFEFAGGIVHSATSGNQVLVSPALVQPIASDDVVAALVDVVEGQPRNGIREIAGPEQIPLVDWVRSYTRALQLPQEVLADANATYFGAEIDDHSLTPDDDALLGNTRYADWISLPGNQR